MPFTKFTNLDFDQIKTSIKDYLRTNSDFTDFDFEGSNFSVLIDTLAYNTYITAFNSNMVVNESFLDSATVRENVVSLARNIGYVPRSRTAAQATISFDVLNTSAINLDTAPSTVTLRAGLVCISSNDNTTFTFSIPEDITTTVKLGSVSTDLSGLTNVQGFTASFNNIKVFQGTFLKKSFIVDGSLDQRFILDNPFIDTSTIVVRVKGSSENGKGTLYTKVDNILNIDSTSSTFLIQEVQDEKYELLFGDGIFGRKLENESIIEVSYIVTDGKEGNGASEFTFTGNIESINGSPIELFTTPKINVTSGASNGGDIESVDSIKYFAPRLYSSQYRAVTARDYEAVIQQIYPNTESVSVVGGEELDPPQFGTVFITIKPQNGDFVSDFDKTQILSNLKNYTLTGISQKIVDLKILHIELESFIYYNSSKVINVEDLKTSIVNGLTTYSRSTEINKFGGRFKYSKVLSVIDNIENSVTSNITRIRIRRNLNALVNQFAQYELCFGNQFNVKTEGLNIKSTGFTIAGEPSTVFLTDTPNSDKKTGVISIVKRDVVTNEKIIIVENAGIVDYIKGEINLTTINITSTQLSNNIIEIQAFPESNDIIGLQDLYLKFNIDTSVINMVKDTISSGDQISGVGYKVTSSYSNGKLTRG
tara:strand:- start:10220 stop:12169 length:1950 start_codon:yes stop_codon:yes gene_type:complete